MKSVEDLVDTLIKGTEVKKLNWVEVSEENFVLSLDNFTITVFEYTDPLDDTTGISAILKDSLENLVDRFSASQFDPKNAVLDVLLTVARRSAKNVENIISAIESQLDGILMK